MTDFWQTQKREKCPGTRFSPSEALLPKILIRLPSGRPDKAERAKPLNGRDSSPAQDLPETVYLVVPGTPIAKPRQTQRDKWERRPCVIRYRDWADRTRKALYDHIGIWQLETARVLTISAYLPMPESWTKKQRAEMRGSTHRIKPDGDNLLKSACDSLVRRDETIYQKEVYKEWAIEGQERVEIFIKL